MADLVLIRNSRSVVGNCCMWWRVDGQGYTCNVAEAWVLDRAAAERMNWRDTDELVPYAPVMALAVRHFDVQLLAQAKKYHAIPEDRKV